MLQRKIIECVPNFSEGQDPEVIKKITDAIESVDEIKLLDVDPGKATNRTVVTFVGEPEPVLEAAFRAIKTAAEVIDMSEHSGAHPRMGATDVCPLVPVANISMDEVVEYAHKLGERAGSELDIPFYMYEYAATSEDRKNLANIRKGEYEGLPEKLQDPEWKPDYGPASFNEQAGATAIGARDFLIAYNVNLNTTSVRRTNSVAFDVRERGRIKRKGHRFLGEKVLDEEGNPVREPGMCKGVKAIGWYIEEYGIAQISMNITDLQATKVHEAFEACRKSAQSHGLRVTGSEMVGLAPKKVLIDAAEYYLKQQRRSVGVSEEEKIKIAVKSLGLDELYPFDPEDKIIEYMLEEEGEHPLVQMKLKDFTNETASESKAPGGGSVAAYVGALGVSLGTMVANISSHKREWDERWEEFSVVAEKGQEIKDDLMRYVDEDTKAFEGIISAFKMPKSTKEEKELRKQAIEDATKHATQVPFEVMRTAFRSFDVLRSMAEKGLPASVTDAGVGALCARAAIHGAYYNVKINAKELNDRDFAEEILDDAHKMLERADRETEEIEAMVNETLDNE